MIRRIIDFSLDNRLLVLLAWLLVVGLGVRALRTLPIDAVPDVTNVQVQVLTNSPGLGAGGGRALHHLPGRDRHERPAQVEEIRSVSQVRPLGRHRRVRGGHATSTGRASSSASGCARRGSRSRRATASRRWARSRPASARSTSSRSAASPCARRGDPDTDACYTPMELRTILDWYVAYQLRSVPGVVEVNTFGGELKTYQVTARSRRGWSPTASPPARSSTPSSATTGNVGGGYIAHAGEQYLVRGEGLIEDLDDMRRHRPRRTTTCGTPVHVGDVGDVELAPMIRQGAVTRDGRGEAVVGIVMMLHGRERPRGRRRGSRTQIAEIEQTLPDGVTIDTFYDRTELVDRTIHTVDQNLLEGGALVIVVLLLLLGNLRGGLIVALGHPALDAGRVHRDAAGRALGQPDEPRRARLRPHRRRLGGHDREHRARAARAPGRAGAVPHGEGAGAPPTRSRARWCSRSASS